LVLSFAINSGTSEDKFIQISAITLSNSWTIAISISSTEAQPSLVPNNTTTTTGIPSPSNFPIHCGPPRLNYSLLTGREAGQRIQTLRSDGIGLRELYDQCHHRNGLLNQTKNDPKKTL
jgi:hypothetical protein